MPRRKRKLDQDAVVAPLDDMDCQGFQLNLRQANNLFEYFEALKSFNSGETSVVKLDLPFQPLRPMAFHVLLQQIVNALSVEDAMFYVTRADPDVLYEAVRAFDFLCASDDLVEAVMNWCVAEDRVYCAAMLGRTYFSGQDTLGVVPDYVHSLDIVSQVFGPNEFHVLRPWMYRALPPGTMPSPLDIYRRARHIAHVAGHPRHELSVAGGAILRCFLHDEGESHHEAWAGSDVDYFITSNFTTQYLPDLIKTPVTWVAHTSHSTLQVKCEDDPNIHNLIRVKSIYDTCAKFDLDCLKVYYGHHGDIMVSVKFLKCLVNRTCMAEGNDVPLPNTLRSIARAQKYAARGFLPPKSWPTLDEPWVSKRKPLGRIRLEHINDITLKAVNMTDFVMFGYSAQLGEGVSPPILSRSTFTSAPLMVDPETKCYAHGPEYFFRRVRLSYQPNDGHAPHATLNMTTEMKNALLQAIKGVPSHNRNMTYLCSQIETGLLDFILPSRTVCQADTDYDLYATPYFKKEHAMAYLVVRWIQKSA